MYIHKKMTYEVGAGSSILTYPAWGPPILQCTRFIVEKRASLLRLYFVRTKGEEMAYIHRVHDEPDETYPFLLLPTV